MRILLKTIKVKLNCPNWFPQKGATKAVEEEEVVSYRKGEEIEGGFYGE